MFGAVPLSMNRDTTKVHFIRSPQQILFTKLFSVTPSTIYPYTSDNTPAHSNPGSFHATTPLGPLNASPDMTPPGSFRTSRTFTGATDAEAPPDDSRRPSLAGSSPPTGLEDAFRSPSSSFSSNYSARRYNRHRSTSIDYVPRDVFEGGAGMGGVGGGPQRRRRMLYTVGCIVRLEDNLKLHDLLFSHFGLVEHRLSLLKEVVARELAAAVSASTFLIGIEQAASDAAESPNLLSTYFDMILI